ncbi:ABC-type spermidine/putrescine transport system permease subunit II [Bradyrhizobium sp. GM7.3]
MDYRVHPVRGRSAVQLVLMSPILVPSIVLALGVYLYFGAAGLSGTKTGIILAHTAYVLPFVIVTASSGIKALDARIEVAAQVVGSSRVQILRYVVIPQLRPTIMVSLLFAFLMSFDEVVLSWFLSGTSATTLPVKMFTAIHWEVSPVLAAVATLLTVISAAACLGAALLQRKPDH